MGKFKLNDKVRLRKDVVVGNSYNKVTLRDYIYEDFKNLCLKINSFSEGDVFSVISESGKNWYVGEDALELYQEYQEGYLYKEGDTLTIGDYEGSISNDGIGYFLDLDSQSLRHIDSCNKLKELFGKDVFTSIAHKCNAVNVKGFFPDFGSIEDLVNFVKELNKLLVLDSKKESDLTTNLTTTKNYQNNEIKFQRAKASCKRGVVPTGSTISGRKDKIAISIGHLSYQVCNC